MKWLGLLLLLTCYPGNATASESSTPADFVRYMALSDFPVEHVWVRDSRATFFLTRDYLMIEICRAEDFDIRRTSAYLDGTDGPEPMSCEDRGPGVPSNTERIAYVRRWNSFPEHAKLIFVVPECLEGIRPANRAEVEAAKTRFLKFMMTFTPDRLAALEREHADIAALRELAYSPRLHERREEAARLLHQISPPALEKARREDDEFYGHIEYELVTRPKEEEEEQRIAVLIARNYPAGIIPKLVIAPEGIPNVIVSLVNRSDSPLTALIFSGTLARDMCNVHFLIWRPGATEAAEYRPYLECRSMSLPDPMTLQPGDSIYCKYDLSEVLTESGVFRLQAIVAYGGAARTKVIEVAIPALTPTAARVRAAELATAEFRTRFPGYPWPRDGSAAFSSGDGTLSRMDGAWQWKASKRMEQSSTPNWRTTANARVMLFDDGREVVTEVSVSGFDPIDGRTRTYSTYGEMWEETADTFGNNGE